VHRRHLTALVVAFVLLFVPAFSARAQSSDSPGDAGIYTTTLANGLRVIVIEDHAAPIVQVATWYRFGSLYETPGKTGLAHALEHMLFRGTSNVSAGGLDDITARIGAEMNGQTDYDYTQFYFTMPSDKIDVALYLEADRMHDALLRQADWNIERGAVLSEIDGDESSPFFNLLSRVRAAAYPDSPNGRTPTGIRNDVANATAADIRRYYNEWYAPNNAALVVAGDVQHAAIFAKVRHYFGNIPSKKLPAISATSPKAISGATVDAQFPFPYEVVDLAYAIPGDTEPGEPAISTLATFIPNQRSPFYQALIQTNIAVDLEADADTQLKGGLLNVFIVLTPGHTAAEAQTVFQATMDNLLKNGIGADLTTTAKQLTIAERVYSADSITGFADLTGYTYGIVGERISDEDSRLAALTPADLDAAMHRYLTAPTVVGHLSPNDRPPAGSSQKSDAVASDNFSNRAPTGPIVEPAWVRAAVRRPTAARSKLHPVAFTLSNGIRVIVQEKNDRPTFTLRGQIDTSPAFAPYGREGIEQLISSAADYASANYTFVQRRKTIDNLGAFVNNGTSFGAQGMSRDFSTILAILADGEIHPTFPEPWFSLERDQLAGTIASQNQISGVVAEHAYKQLLLATDDPSLRVPTSDTVSAISRDDLLAFAKAYWRPDLTSIVIVGDITPEHARTALEAAFGSWRAQGPAPGTKQLPLPLATAGHNYVETAGTQVYVQLGQPALARTSPDYDAMTVLVQILGGEGDFESRLWQQLRQQTGLVYSAGAGLHADADRGDLRIQLSAATNNVVPAITIVRRELERLQREPVSQTELLEARTRLVSTALLSEESADGQADELQDIALNRLPLDYYQTLSDRYARVTAADVQRVARKYLRPDKLIEVFTGPPGPWSRHSI
jgi:zinc protease